MRDRHTPVPRRGSCSSRAMMSRSRRRQYGRTPWHRLQRSVWIWRRTFFRFTVWLPMAYVKPYVKRGKPDAADAEAIAEAVTRPTMRFVAVKTVDQQALLMLHKVRDLLVRQRTMLTNALRGQMAEYGMIAA